MRSEASQPFGQDVNELARALGTPLRHSVRVGSADLWAKRNRPREVCMVIRRPSGNLLTFTKTFYPEGIYRLPTGGVEPGEGVLEALCREVAEETGLEVRITRFLALISYYAEDRDEPEPRSSTFAFLMEEVGGVLTCADPDEQVEAFSDVSPDGLLAMATKLDQLPEQYTLHFEETWRDWGRWRAAVHQAVWQALSGPRASRQGS